MPSLCLAALCGIATPASAQARDAGTDPATRHWAYTPPARPALEVGSSIDDFIRRRLQARGLRLAPRAERVRLLRRVYLDVIGLPPTVEEIDAFLSDESADAYDDLVDRLLASRHFGEHWARHWLDLARYADSNGYQADQLRESWAYRDWVIDALNADMPFDRFTIEQLAGDLLPESTLDQKIATGFHRTVTCNVEAGVHPEANRVDQVFDRVNTTGIVWLGTTLSCAQCHDHKHDPISQKEYYRLFAFFNNTPIEVKNPLGKGVRFDFVGPQIDLPLRPEQQRERARLEREVTDAKQRHENAIGSAKRRQREWEARMTSDLDRGSRWRVLDIAAFESTGDEDFRILDDQSVLVGGRLPGTATYTVRVETSLGGITAFRLETLTHPSLPGTGPGRGDDSRPNFILSEFSVSSSLHPSIENEAPAVVALETATADYEQKGWSIGAAIDGDPRTGWAIGGAFFEDHEAVFTTREPLPAGAKTLTFTLDQNYGRGRTIGRLRLSAFTGDPSLLALPAEIATILRKKRRSASERRRLTQHYLRTDPLSARSAAALANARQRLAKLRPHTTLVMVEADEPRTTTVLQRGDYLAKGEAVDPDTPRVLHPFPPGEPRNRLGLARWLVHPANPLVARVAVNRWWSQIFGRGIVATEEDFGTRAEPPTHPELLDWLAVEFVESGWSMKHVIRLILKSETYRQSSRAGSKRRAIDADNLLYARGPRFRMTAEMIRDSALTASGLLSTKAGGPPIYPPQPPGLWRQTGRNEPKYVVAADEARYRRGIYVVWRRAAPYPSFVLFDGPDRSSCHPRRSRTNTPMQALALMNDTAFVEMAMALAQRMQRRANESSLRAAIVFGFRSVLSRRPNELEIDHLLRVHEREYARLRRAPELAKAIVDGVPHVRAGIDEPAVTQVASWFFVANILLNLDEAITKG